MIEIYIHKSMLLNDRKDFLEVKFEQNRIYQYHQMIFHAMNEMLKDY